MATNTESVDLVGDEAAANLARAALFAALVGAFAYVSFPNPLSAGVPITLQVLGVFLAGIMLGPVWGALSMVLYLAAGAVGAPVFSGGTAGISYLIASPTLGFLWSYPFAAGAIGLVAHRGTDLSDVDAVPTPVLVGAMVAGTAIIYGFGTVGFAVIQYDPWYASLWQAFAVSSLAFVPVEAVKIAAAVGIVKNDAIAAA